MEPNLQCKFNEGGIHFYSNSKENKMNATFNSFLILFFMGIFILLGNFTLMKFGGLSSSSYQLNQYSKEKDLVPQLFMETNKMKLMVAKIHSPLIIENHHFPLNKKGAKELFTVLQKNKIKSSSLNMLLVRVGQRVSVEKIHSVFEELQMIYGERKMYSPKYLFLEGELLIRKNSP